MVVQKSGVTSISVPGPFTRLLLSIISTLSEVWMSAIMTASKGPVPIIEFSMLRYTVSETRGWLKNSW